MTALIRLATPADHDGLATLWADVWPDYPVSAAEMRHEDVTWDHARYFVRKLVALDGGTILGWAEAKHSPHAFVPTTYHLDGVVAATRRGQGIGAALYEALAAELTTRGALVLAASAKESEGAGVRFLERRGFREDRREWESRLDLSGFDFAPFAGGKDRAAGEGVTIATLADEHARLGDEAYRRAFVLSEAVCLDLPSSDAATPSPFKHWRQMVIERPGALPDAYFLAVRGGAYVGLSSPARPVADGTFFWQNLTGVLRAERGKGIALALKLRTVRYAREHGRREIKTWNDQSNRPMLAINEAMGFVRQPAWIELRKELGPQG